MLLHNKIGNDVIFQCLSRHSCQFKPQKCPIVFQRALVPTNLKKVPPPMVEFKDALTLDIGYPSSLESSFVIEIQTHPRRISL